MSQLQRALERGRGAVTASRPAPLTLRNCRAEPLEFVRLSYEEK